MTEKNSLNRDFTVPPRRADYRQRRIRLDTEAQTSRIVGCGDGSTSEAIAGYTFGSEISARSYTIPKQVRVRRESRDSLGDSSRDPRWFRSVHSQQRKQNHRSWRYLILPSGRPDEKCAIRAPYRDAEPQRKHPAKFITWLQRACV